MTIFLNRGTRPPKYQLFNYANQNINNKNATEIVKSTLYGPDNYLLRTKSEREMCEMIQKMIHSKVSSMHEEDLLKLFDSSK